MYSYNKGINFLKKDPKLSGIINKVGPFNIKTTRNYYQLLIEAIITQQLSGFAANAILKRFRILYGTRFPKPDDVIKTRNSKLQKTGLSKMKISYIKDLSKNIENKKLNLKTISKFNDEEIISTLTQTKGIGRWTAEMFLIFSLGRLDVLPVGDLGLKKGIQKTYSLQDIPDEAQIIEIAKSWRPYRTIATWYLWKSLKNFDAIG